MAGSSNFASDVGQLTETFQETFIEEAQRVPLIIRPCRDSSESEPWTSSCVGDNNTGHGCKTNPRIPFDFEARDFPYERYDDIPVQTSGSNVPNVIKGYEEASLSPKLLANAKRQFEKLVPIQKHAIPVILHGRDLMAVAQTGTGKTAAYLIPVIELVLRLKERDIRQARAKPPVEQFQAKPKALIIVPTRELAEQIYQKAGTFSCDTACDCYCLFGGQSIFYLCSELFIRCSILVATPGRLLHAVRDGLVCLEDINIFVLDEADRMLDRDFKEEVDRISIILPSRKITLMFSATFPDKLQDEAKKYLKTSYVCKYFGTFGAANYDVKQIILNTKDVDKTTKLIELLVENTDFYGNAWHYKKTLVFVQRKTTVDALAIRLEDEGFIVEKIHKNRTQLERCQALKHFETGRSPILVATSVAARGLDIPDIDHVINYYFTSEKKYTTPSGIEDWVHRVGRTGRGGKKGRATTFYDPDIDCNWVDMLLKELGKAKQTVGDWLLKEAKCYKNDPVLNHVPVGEDDAEW